MDQRWLGFVFGLGVAAVYSLFWRLRPVAVKFRSRPAQSYDEAVDRCRLLQALDGADIEPLCRTQLLSHGAITAKSIVLLHGYSNCPRQFHQIATTLFELCYNVIVPRMPYHGLRTRTPSSFHQLTIEDLLFTTYEAIDIARGLGLHVTVLGFSLGGTVAAWVAQERDDIDLALLLSPVFGLRPLPSYARRAVINLLTWLPPWFRWWNPKRRGEIDGPRHAYAWYSSRGIALNMRLGLLVAQRAKHKPAGARRIVLLNNPSDPLTDCAVALKVVANWRALGGDVHVEEFDRALDLPHDIVDPAQPHAQPELIYPFIYRLLTPPI
jgi:pimeloyl-ACP methyl ester carboxylesterase